jgi:transcription factor SFP1
MHVVVIGADGRPVYPAPPSPPPSDQASVPPSPSKVHNTDSSSDSASPYSHFHPHLAQHSSRAPVASIVIDYPKPYPPATPGAYHMPGSPFADVARPESGLGLGLDVGPCTFESKIEYSELPDPYDPFGLTSSSSHMPLDVDPPSPVSSASPTLSMFDHLNASTVSSPMTSVYSTPSPNPSEPACLPPALLSLPPHTGVDGSEALRSFEPSPEPFTALPPSSLPHLHPFDSHYISTSSSRPTPTPPAFRAYHTSPSHSSHAQRLKARLLARSPPSSPSTPKIAGQRRHRTRADRSEREKAYRCPNAFCTKRYLNPNGLKYHIEKGTCTHAGPRPWENVSAVAVL